MGCGGISGPNIMNPGAGSARLMDVAERLLGMKLKFSFALLLAVAPALALASQSTPPPASVSQRTPTAHLRPQLYHDRSPKAHVHESSPHRAS
jgi:hypothetical protein